MQKNRNIEKIALKVVQRKLLDMDITNQKLSFDTVGNLQKYIYGTYSFLNILMIFYLWLVLLSRVTYDCFTVFLIINAGLVA